MPGRPDDVAESLLAVYLRVCRYQHSLLEFSGTTVFYPPGCSLQMPALWDGENGIQIEQLVGSTLPVRERSSSHLSVEDPEREGRPREVSEWLKVTQLGRCRARPTPGCMSPTLSIFCITLVGTSVWGGRQESLKVKDQRERKGLEDSEPPQTERGITVRTPGREPACGSSPGNAPVVPPQATLGV